MQPNFIAGYNSGGLVTDKKPFLLPNEAFSRLENAYVWRERVKKREALKLLGRLRRDLTVSQTSTQAGATYTDTDLLDSVRATEANAEIEPGSITFKIDPGGGNETIYKDNVSNGVLTYISGTYTGSGTINYVSGAVSIAWASPPGAGKTTSSILKYFPSLPVMGIWQREIAGINNEETIFFDEKYAYKFLAGGFQEFIAGTTWASSDSDFFWATNYRGSSPENRLFFVTNDLNDAADPMRYTDGSTWTDFTPAVDGTNFLLQARVLVPYYGRLLALNCTEGTVLGGGSNIFNRCRFSQIGNPVASDAWQSNIFGKGGFIDAPINEAIVSATFIKNTLLVQFERSTWQLRYVGEYGLPFIWERVSSDFGSESTFSPVIFDDGVLAVGDRAIVAASAVTVQRIDEQIPDLVFDIRNADLGTIRVWGVRDYQRELVFWNYSDAQLGRKFPNKVICYNYRNQTYAIFRDNITAFGVYQPATDDATWDSLTVLWDDNGVFWDDVQVQSQFPLTVCGNQQGFVHLYGYRTVEEQSLSITAIDLTADPIRVTIPNHNLEEGEIIQIKSMQFFLAGVPTPTNLNNILYVVAERIDVNVISLARWDTDDQIYVNLNYTDFPDITPVNTATYIGGGTVTLYPRMFAQTKDMNPYLASGNQLKIIYVDFLTTNTGAQTSFTVELYVNTSDSVKGNVITGNRQSETYLQSPYYVPNSDIAWHRFYATANGQFIRILLTFDNDLMDDLATLDAEFELNAMTCWTRLGSKVIF